MASPTITLADILSHFTPPSTFTFDTSSSSTSTIPSQTVLDQHVAPNLPLCYTRDAREGKQDLDAQLLDLLQRLDLDMQTAQQATPGGTNDTARRRINDLLGKLDMLTEISADDQSHGVPLSGEVGLQCLLDKTVMQATNAVLTAIKLLGEDTRAANRIPEFRLAWRVVGSGAGGKADFELVLLIGRVSTVIAVIEIKRSDVVKPNHFVAMIDACRGGLEVTAANINAPAPREGVPIHTAKWWRPLVQGTGQWATRRCKTAALFTGENLVMFDVDDEACVPRAANAPGYVRVSTQRTSFGGLTTSESLLGALVSLSLRAMQRAGFLHYLLRPSAASQPPSHGRVSGNHDMEQDDEDDDARTVRGEPARIPWASGSGWPSGSGGNDSLFNARSAFSQRPDHDEIRPHHDLGASSSSDRPMTPRLRPNVNVHGLATPDGSPDSQTETKTTRDGFHKVPAPLNFVGASARPLSPRISPVFVLHPSQLGDISFCLSIPSTSRSGYAFRLELAHPCFRDVQKLSEPFYGPVDIAAWRSEHAILPRLSIHTSAADAPSHHTTRQLSIDDFVGTGGSCAVFSAHETTLPSANLAKDDGKSASTTDVARPSLIAKMSNSDGFAQEKPLTDLYTFTSSDIRRSLWREAAILHGQLEDLQGRGVPRFYGLFGSLQQAVLEGQAWTPTEQLHDAGASLELVSGSDEVNADGNNGETNAVLDDELVGGPAKAKKGRKESLAEVWCMLQADVGGPLDSADRDRYGVREKVLEIYDSIHSRGVLHGDVHWRHLRRSKWSGALGDDTDRHHSVRDGIFVIDFGNARMRDASVSQGEWDTWCQEERLMVRELFSC